MPGKKKHFLFLLFITVISIVVLQVSLSSQQSQEARWYKGQTHAHTTNSDGDELPRRVVRWYLDHNYQFLVISDHNKLTDITYLDTDKNDDFILIPGEEVTDYLDKIPLHINGINIKKEVAPRHGKSKVETLQNNIDAVIEAGGIAQVNHPNWQWSFSTDEIQGLKNVKLLEIYNTNKDCNNFDAGGSPGMETVWDRLLSRGFQVYGVASDDTHNYEGEFRAGRAYPGQGWIVVRARILTPGAIVEALEKGDFYATVGFGVELDDIVITPKEYRLTIHQQYDFKYTTQFIGKDGKVLEEDFGLTPAYSFKGDEMYIRAKVLSSSGDFAITQPVFGYEIRQ